MHLAIAEMSPTNLSQLAPMLVWLFYPLQFYKSVEPLYLPFYIR